MYRSILSSVAVPESLDGAFTDDLDVEVLDDFFFFPFLRFFDFVFETSDSLAESGVVESLLSFSFEASITFFKFLAFEWFKINPEGNSKG